MGQLCSSHFRPGDTLHTENNTVQDSQIVEHDKTRMDESITSAECDSRPNADSVSPTSVDVHNANNASSSTSTVYMPAVAADKSGHGNTKHLPWFFANMTEEHWERLNMMCIEIPSSS